MDIKEKLPTCRSMHSFILLSNIIEIELTDLWLIYLRKTAGYVTLKAIESEAVTLPLLRRGPAESSP